MQSVEKTVQEKKVTLNKLFFQLITGNLNLTFSAPHLSFFSWSSSSAALWSFSSSPCSRSIRSTLCCNCEITPSVSKRERKVQQVHTRPPHYVSFTPGSIIKLKETWWWMGRSLVPFSEMMLIWLASSFSSSSLTSPSCANSFRSLFSWKCGVLITSCTGDLEIKNIRVFFRNLSFSKLSHATLRVSNIKQHFCLPWKQNIPKSVNISSLKYSSVIELCLICACVLFMLITTKLAFFN